MPRLKNERDEQICQERVRHSEWNNEQIGLKVGYRGKNVAISVTKRLGLSNVKARILELRKTLEKQVDGDIMKRMYTDDVTPFIDPDFIDLEWEYEYTPTLDIDKSKFKSTSETEMQFVDMEIKYDKTKENMKYLDTKIKYDKIIDKTEENKKFINPTNDWKTIYDNQER